jgi:hypothetical protein
VSNVNSLLLVMPRLWWLVSDEIICSGSFDIWVISLRLKRTFSAKSYSFVDGITWFAGWDKWSYCVWRNWISNFEVSSSFVSNCWRWISALVFIVGSSLIWLDDEVGIESFDGTKYRALLLKEKF